MKIGFMGSPLVAAMILENLLKHDIKIYSVYTKKAKPSGRGHKITPSPVAKIALKHNISLKTPKSLKTDEFIQEFQAIAFDLVIVVAYGLILPPKILATPKYGCINVHASLLPKFRGAAPIQRAIEFGEKITGITIMQMDSGLDTGDILLTKELPITTTTTATDLFQQLPIVSTELLLKVLPLIEQQKLTPIKQDNSLATYAQILSKDEGKINFSETALTIERKIRAFNLFPTSFFLYNNELIKVISAEIVIMDTKNYQYGEVIDAENIVIATKQNALKLNKLQRPGKNPLLFQEFLKGFIIKKGTILQ